MATLLALAVEGTAFLSVLSEVARVLCVSPGPSLWTQRMSLPSSLHMKQFQFSGVRASLCRNCVSLSAAVVPRLCRAVRWTAKRKFSARSQNKQTTQKSVGTPCESASSWLVYLRSVWRRSRAFSCQFPRRQACNHTAIWVPHISSLFPSARERRGLRTCLEESRTGSFQLLLMAYKSVLHKF